MCLYALCAQSVSILTERMHQIHCSLRNRFLGFGLSSFFKRQFIVFSTLNYPAIWVDWTWNEWWHLVKPFAYCRCLLVYYYGFFDPFLLLLMRKEGERMLLCYLLSYFTDICIKVKNNIVAKRHYTCNVHFFFHDFSIHFFLLKISFILFVCSFQMEQRGIRTEKNVCAHGLYIVIGRFSPHKHTIWIGSICYKNVHTWLIQRINSSEHIHTIPVHSIFVFS